MNTLEHRLRGLRDAEADDRLDGLEDRVMHGLGIARERLASRRQLAFTASFALLTGMAGSMVPVSGTPAQDGLTGAPALAPSQLLGR